MQQFFTLFRKEFQLYFSGLSAYILIFAYLFASFGSAFYFGGYLAERNGSLYSLFASQPYLLIILIPALTIRSWAEEYKTNTAEFLLTLPIKTPKIIMAKFCFSACFFVALSLGLLPFIIYTAQWQMLDWLNILSSYAGLWLLIILLTSFGCFISALSRNLVIVYILNLFILIPAAIISQTGLIPVYQNFLFAEVGISDVFYFISLSTLFLYLNSSAIKYRRNLQKNSFFGFSLMAFSALTANIIMYFGLSLIEYRVDFTSSNLYSLSNKTEQIIKQIKTPTKIDLYIAEDFYKTNNSSSHYFEQIKRFLHKYQAKSKGMIQISATKIPAFSEKENELTNLGFYTTKNPKGGKNYFGAIITNNKNETQIIRQFLPQRQAYLEEDIDRALLKASFPELKKNIGVYLDSEQNLENYEGVGLILENEYNTGTLDNSSYQIHKTTDAVILFNPKSLSSVFLYALDQYVMHGGKLIIFLDRQTTNQFDKINDEAISIMRLLNHWGIELGGEPFDEITDTKFLSNTNLPLAIHSAYGITINNEDLHIEPLITNGNNLLGVKLSGEFKSYYRFNPFNDTPIGELMRPYKAKTDSATISIIADADILDEKNWIEESSPDRDIFGAIEKAGNGRFIRALVDYVVGNNIYAELPKNKSLENRFSLSEKISNLIKKKDEKIYEQIKNEADDLALQVWLMSGADTDNIKQFIDMTEEGRRMQALVEQMNEIKYQHAEKYNQQVKNLMIFFIFILPLIESLLTFAVFGFYALRRKKQIKEIIK